MNVFLVTIVEMQTVMLNVAIVLKLTSSMLINSVNGKILHSKEKNVQTTVQDVTTTVKPVPLTETTVTGVLVMLTTRSTKQPEIVSGHTLKNNVTPIVLLVKTVETPTVMLNVFSVKLLTILPLPKDVAQKLLHSLDPNVQPTVELVQTMENPVLKTPMFVTGDNVHKVSKLDLLVFVKLIHQSNNVTLIVQLMLVPIQETLMVMFNVTDVKNHITYPTISV